MTPRSTQNAAFTLVELSIVLVIIALVVSGIFIGKDILRNAQLQSVVSGVSDIEHAMQQFRDKYKYLPGDFPNATTIWGAYGGCGVNTGGTTNTCNGDGDGFVSAMTNPSTSYTLGAENYYAWKHLANAEMLTPNYDSNGYGRPVSRITNSMYTLFYTRPTSSVSGVFNAQYGHVIAFGAKYTSSSYPSYGALLTGAEAMAIDQKMDDGAPGKGVVLSYTTASGSPTRACASSATASSATYNISSSTTPNCSLLFITGY